MRILHVVDTLKAEAGGPPKIAASLAAAQADLGHQVTILTDLSGVQLSDLASDLAVSLKSVSVIHAPRGNVATLLKPPAIEVTRPILNSDVVHLHSVWDILLLQASRAAHATKVPYFVLLNGMLDPWSLNQSKLKKRLALLLGYREMLDNAAALHLGNADELDLIKTLKLQTPSEIIPNGIFLNEIDPLPSPGTFRQIYPSLGASPFVLFLSRLHYKKGLDVLAEAFIKLASDQPTVHLVVAGPDGGAQNAFENRIINAGLSGRVHVVGPIYGANKYKAMVDATCFCLPSRQEGFSMAITEALACGLPAVVSEGCHFPEIDEYKAGCVTSLNYAAIAQALKKFLLNPYDCAVAGTNGRALVEKSYTWPQIAKQTITMYEKYMKH